MEAIWTHLHTGILQYFRNPLKKMLNLLRMTDEKIIQFSAES